MPTILTPATFTTPLSVTVGSVVDTGQADFMTVIARTGLSVACSEDNVVPLVVRNKLSADIATINSKGDADFMAGNFRSGLVVTASASPIAFTVKNNSGVTVASIFPNGKGDFSVAGIRTFQGAAPPVGGSDGDIVVSSSDNRLYVKIGGTWRLFTPDNP